MAQSAAFSILGSEFNDFLFASIGDDRNDMPLSVLSALSRLDIDPWQEASELARLPGEIATQKLASLISALPDGPSAQPDPGTNSARLIALLPRRVSNIPSREVLFSVGAIANYRADIYVVIINVVIVLFLMGGQWFAATRQQHTLVDSAQVPATSKVLSQTPPPNSGQ
jgi:hypothetical protein